MRTWLITQCQRGSGEWSLPILARQLAGLVWLITGYGLVAQPNIYTHPQSASASLEGTVVFTVEASTTSPPLFYQWELDGNNLPGATAATLTLQKITLDQEGTYTVVVWDSSGSTTSRPALLDVDPTFIQANRDRLGDDGFLETGADGPFPFWIDFDGDGWLEVVVRRGQSVAPPRPNEVYENNRDGTFTRITNGLAQLDGRWFAPSWADYDRDGDLDCLFTQEQPNAPYMFLNQQSQGTADFTAIPLADLTLNHAQTPGITASAADYDGDGWIDLAISHYLGGGTNALLHNVGGRFEVVTNTPFALSGETIEGHNWVDYDDDGDVDFFGITSLFGASAHKDILFQNQGNGELLRISDHVLVNQVTPNIMAAWGDYDNDRDLDVFLSYHDTLPSMLYRNIGSGRFEPDTAAPQLSMASGPCIASWGDYDNDGDLDLMVTQDYGRCRLFNNDGTGRLTEVWVGSPTAPPLSAAFYAWWADYNNDGFLDLLALRYKQRSGLFLNNLPQAGNQNHWLKVQLKGWVSNPNALGAKVRVQATMGGRTVWQMRQVGIWTAFATDMPAHFGLGDASHVEVLRIEWPSGMVQEVQNIKANQILTVTEPEIGFAPPAVATSPGSNITVGVGWFDVVPASYQWRFNGTLIEGATNATLELSNIQPSQSGVYTVEMVEGLQRVISQPVLVTVYPAITRQPQSLTVTNDTPVTFSVTAATVTPPLTYQWRFNTTPLANETNTTLTIPSAQAEHDGLYTVTVSDALGSVTSDPARLTVRLKPRISQLVTNYTVVQGGNLTLSVEANGEQPVTYVWRRMMPAKERQTNYSHQSFFTLTNVQPAEDKANGVYYLVNLINSLTVAAGVQSDRIYITVLTDSDGDGMDDDWEAKYPTCTEPDGDTDSDGLTNKEEYQSGTIPTDSQSYLKVERIAVSGEARIEFIAAANQTYTVEYNNSLQEAVWEKLADVVAGPVRTVVLSDPAASTHHFYRLVTPRQPSTN